MPDDWENIPEYIKIGHYLGRNFGSFEDMAERLRAYLAIARFGDDMMGEIVDHIDANLPDCLTMIFSDHGYHLYDRGKGLGKATLWRNCLRAPLIFHGQDVPNGEYNQSVSLLDVAPTICEVLEVDPAPHFEGLSLVPAVYSRDNVIHASISDQYALGGSYAGDFTGHTVITDDWQLIRYKDGTQELFDLSDDNYVSVLGGGDNSVYDPIIYGLSAYLPRWDDLLEGGHGDDQYIVGGGDTVIIEDAGEDVIRFVDVLMAEISTSQDGMDLLIAHPMGSVCVKNYYDESFASVITIECDDGVVGIEGVA